MNDDAVQVLVAMRDTAKAYLDLLACPHAGAEYGACWDCRNTGYLPTCEEEDELITHCEAVVRRVDALLPEGD